jgi:AhpD family alkylhydroperoxidase
MKLERISISHSASEEAPGSRAVEVFDPAMCCSTGVCGPAVDPALSRFAADLEWLAGQGIRVSRHNLAQEPQAFAGNQLVREALSSGTECLPLILVDGKVASQGRYPERQELAEWTGLAGEIAPGIYSEAVAELVAIGAAIASNCEPCFRYHYGRARELGVSREDMMRAVRTAQMVKDTPALAVLALAEKYLGEKKNSMGGLPVLESTQPSGKGCC